MVEYSFGNEMDENAEREMLTTPPQFIAEISETAVRDKAHQLISAGIVDGTRDNERFERTYLNARLTQVKRTRGN